LQEFCRTTKCPAEAGDISIAYEYMLPGISPPGHYSIQLTGRSNKEEDLFCFLAHFSVRRPGTETA
jgi:hypothetical protein